MNFLFGRRKGMALAERLARLSASSDTGCRLWAGMLDEKGYARIQVGAKLRKAHVVAWELQNGPVPAGLELDHTCRIRSCICPGHLEPVTHRENVLRSTSPTAINAAKTHCPRGHEYDYVTPRGARQCRTCAKENHARFRERRRAEAA